MKNVLLIEDDSRQSAWMVGEIQNVLSANVYRYFSEFSFLNTLDKGSLPQPDFAIIDLFMRYYSPDDLKRLELQNPTPSGLNPKQAGIRCRDALLSRFPETKVVIVTVLGEEEFAGIPEDYRIIQKGDLDLEAIIEEFLTDGT